MSDNTKQNLTKLLADGVYRIPDYQRGYAWEEKQVKDLIQDVDALVSDEGINSHYMGTVVTFKTTQTETYKKSSAAVLDVVDGQQRLTSILLFLSVVLAELKKHDEEYGSYVTDYLYSGAVPKLQLNGADRDFYLSLLKSGGLLTGTVTETNTPQRKRLCRAANAFRKYVASCDVAKLEKLYDAMTSKLRFSGYSIEEECEIGMTFELMNSRGKGLSVLELLKNYLMYWVSRNVRPDEGREDLTRSVNTNWAEVYKYLGACNGDDGQCLRIAWINYFDYLPKKWSGYDGFKDVNCIPIRDFSHRSKEETRAFIEKFIDGLVVVARSYAQILHPSDQMPRRERMALDDVRHTGNIANALPLIVSLRMAKEAGRIVDDDYIRALRALECFSFRTFLWERRRSNAGRSQLFRLAQHLTNGVVGVEEVVKQVYGLANYYAPVDKFKAGIAELQDWYGRSNLVRCILFAYEQYLVDRHHPGESVKITWREVADESTLEHVLPQTPKSGSHWREVWDDAAIARWTHSLGNLVFTRDNSRYLNFEFTRKRDGVDDGTPVSERYCYRNSNIMQERKIADASDWTPVEVEKRHNELLKWITDRWCPDAGNAIQVQVKEAEDEEQGENA